MSFAAVIQQNNNGVAYLNANDFRNAIESFSSAVRLQKALEAINCISLSCIHEEGDCVDQHMLLRDIDEEVQAPTSMHTFIYDHAIVLLPTVQDPCVVTPILIFNLALAQQLMAIRGTHDCDVSFNLRHKARKLYELVYRTQGMNENPLFQFAIFNNVAVIDREFGNESMSRECFEYLVSVLMMFVDQGCTSHLQHVQGFLVNVPCTIENAAAA